MSAENDEESKEIGSERNRGVQPLDALLRDQGLTNHDVVAASKHPLTHKTVQRARVGRQLTMRTQRLVIEAYNAAVRAKTGEGGNHTLTQLFTYKA